MGLALNIQPAKASGTNIEVSPNTTVDYGGNFILSITVNDVTDMCGWEVGIIFRKIINITNVVEKTSFFDGSLFWFMDNYSYNYYGLSVASWTLSRGVSGSGVVAELNFSTVYNGTTQIEISGSTILDSENTEIPHTSSSCNVTVLGINQQYFLNIVSPSHGTLNVTQGVYIYDNGTDVAIEATETTWAFQYFKVDNTTYTTKTIVVTMSSDHEVSALFKVPVLTIYTTYTQPSQILRYKSVMGFTLFPTLQTVAVTLHLNYP
jgi:hypothetical protein